jgi:hypothetical protein
MTKEYLYPDITIHQIAQDAIAHGSTNDCYMALLRIRDGIENSFDRMAEEHEREEAMKYEPIRPSL